MRLTEAIESLLMATRADGRSPKTVVDYERKLRPLQEFLGDVDVNVVTVDDLRRFVVSLQTQAARWEDHPRLATKDGGLSPFSIAGYVRAVKRLFNFLEAEGIVEHNPTRRLQLKQPKARVPKSVVSDDVSALLETTAGNSAADLRDRAIILLLTDSGCRVSGLCSLRLEYLDVERGVALVMEKGEKVRAIMFSEITAAALSAWLAVRRAVDSTAVFLSLKGGGDLSVGAVGEMLKRRAKRAGIEGRVNPHSFRHAFAREYLLSGGDLGTLSDILGHSDVAITKTFYAIFTLGELQEQHRKHSPVTKLLGWKEKDVTDTDS